MLTISNAVMRLSMREDGTNVSLFDLRGRTLWELDESTRYVSQEAQRLESDAYRYEAVHSTASKVALTGKGKASRLGPGRILTQYKTRQGNVSILWALEPDRLRVIANFNIDNPASSLSLPGVFRPADNEHFLSAIPHTQGIIHTGKGPAFYKALYNPAFIFMCFFAQMAKRSALLSVMEDDVDVCVVWEKTSAGTINLQYVEQPEFGKLAYPRENVFVFTRPDITSICKRYRDYEKEKGRFVTWKEKIAQRPNVKKLLGSVTAFVGYHNDTDFDYRKGLLAMKDMGITKARIEPAFIGTTAPFRYPYKGKLVDNLALTSLNPLIKKLGYSPCAFIYITAGKEAKGKDPYKAIMVGHDGKPKVNWVMPDGTFYYLSLKERFNWVQKYLDNQCRTCDGVHFDTLSANWLHEDYGPAKTSGRDDYNMIRQILQYACDKGMYTVTEGFCGRLTPWLDQGSTKFQHMGCRDEYYCVPMTMLVYHECAQHIWWEVDNYNNAMHRAQGGREWGSRYYFGGGRPEIQSAIDAIAGTPPDIMPFGLQYTFLPKNEPEIYFYRFRPEEPRLKEVLPYVQSVQKLQARVASLEMTELNILKSDGAVQESIFADGTRVIANFSNTALDIKGHGHLPAESFKVTR